MKKGLSDLIRSCEYLGARIDERPCIVFACFAYSLISVHHFLLANIMTRSILTSVPSMYRSLGETTATSSQTDAIAPDTPRNARDVEFDSYIGPYVCSCNNFPTS